MSLYLKKKKTEIKKEDFWGVGIFNLRASHFLEVRNAIQLSCKASLFSKSSLGVCCINSAYIFYESDP